MKTITVVTLLTFVSSVFGADDIRSKVTDSNDAKKLTRQIDPDKSIYGIPFGTTEDEFIARNGKPTGYVRLSGAETAMIYGKSHAFIFEGGSLVGIRITHSIVDWKLSNAYAPSPFDGINWQLANGIESEMSLTQVRKILGDKLSTKRYPQYYYMTEKAQVELDFSRYTSAGEGDDAHRVYGILVKQGAPERDDAWRGISEEFGGVGMLIVSNKWAEFLDVGAVTPDGPADKAGVRPGMAIVAVDGTALSGRTLPESVALLRGKPGSKVTLEIFDPTARKTNKVTITRIAIKP
jgi:membrane-associated protease RseP (regulator of RpoE activity)